MNLIIISYDFPPSDGGIARLCQEIAQGQSKFFEEVKVLTPQTQGHNITYNFHEIKRVEFSSKRGITEIEILKYLKKIKNKSNHVLLCATWHPEGFLAYCSGFQNVFFLAHGTELLSGTSAFRKNVWLPIYAKKLLKKPKAVICNSNFTKKLVQNIQPNAKAIALPLAVNESFFVPLESKEPKDKFVLSSVSRIEKFKGHDFIATVISKLPDAIKNKIHWNIAGNGPDLPELKQLVKSLQIQDLVSFKGYVADQDLPDFYNQSDVFVLCSRESKQTITVEGFGLVFLEAQACGIPAIGTRTGGISDAIEHNNGGFLIDQDNQNQLHDILIKLISDPSFLNNQKKLARQRVLNGFTWKSYNEKLNQIISSNL